MLGGDYKELSLERAAGGGQRFLPVIGQALTRLVENTTKRRRDEEENLEGRVGTLTLPAGKGKHRHNG